MIHDTLSSTFIDLTLRPAGHRPNTPHVIRTLRNNPAWANSNTRHHHVSPSHAPRPTPHPSILPPAGHHAPLSCSRSRQAQLAGTGGGTRFEPGGGGGTRFVPAGGGGPCTGTPHPPPMWSPFSKPHMHCFVRMSSRNLSHGCDGSRSAREAGGKASPTGLSLGCSTRGLTPEAAVVAGAAARDGVAGDRRWAGRWEGSTWGGLVVAGGAAGCAGRATAGAAAGAVVGRLRGGGGGGERARTGMAAGNSVSMAVGLKATGAAAGSLREGQASDGEFAAGAAAGAPVVAAAGTLRGADNLPAATPAAARSRPMRPTSPSPCRASSSKLVS